MTRKKAEKERKSEGRNENDRTTERKKEKNCRLGVSLQKSDFNIIIGGLEFNIFGTSS